MIRTVGITGGIGSGKSHLCRLFEKHNIPVFYFDDEARQLYENGDVIDKMVLLFGSSIYDWSNPYNPTLNKEKLGSIIFSDDSKRIQVEKLLRPELMKVFYDAMYNCEFVEKHSLFVAESATMIKSSLYKNFDHIIYVAADYEKRKEMVMKNRGISEIDFVRRYNLQLSDGETVSLLEKNNMKYTWFHNDFDEKSESFVLDFILKINQ